MNETPVSIGQMHSFYLYMYNGEYYDRPGTIPHLYSKTGVYTGIYMYLVFLIRSWVRVRTHSARRF